MSILDWIFGTDSTPAQVPTPRDYKPMEPLPYPTAMDVAEARDYKQRFGNTNEQMITGRNPGDETQPYRMPVGSLLTQVTPSDVKRYYNEGQRGLLSVKPPSQQKPLDAQTADALYGAQIAAQRSPLGYLGYDANRMVATGANDPGPHLTVAGLYNPEEDRLWVDTRTGSTPVHESMHRAFRILQGNLPKDAFRSMQADGTLRPYVPNEEIFVRASMLRHHGEQEVFDAGGEHPEITEARQMLKNPGFVKQLDEFERLANEEIARRNLARGPM